MSSATHHWQLLVALTFPPSVSDVLFPILQLQTIWCLLVVFKRKKRLDIDHGSLNVLAEPVRVL